MRVQTEEWQRFIPGVRMYKGKKTYFWNGEILWEGNRHNDRPLIYDIDERNTWEVIIVLPGVEVIPRCTFGCLHVKTVIMADSVKRIEYQAFKFNKKLTFVKLSRNLEFIGDAAFLRCESLTSMFIPDSCRQIGFKAFHGCKKLMILHIPHHTGIRGDELKETALIKKYNNSYLGNTWVKFINRQERYGLHRLCSSMDPSEDEIYQMICEQGGLHAMAQKNGLGITPSEYLAANPYADVDEMKLMKRFVLENIGEII